MSAQRLAWSLRRELWEHRAVYFAPLLIVGIALVAMLFHMRRVVPNIRMLESMEPAKQAASALLPFGITASAVLATSWIVAVYYCIECLHSERRDRSILFWKSMPVSDSETVASKAIMALVVIPLVGLVIALGLQAALLGMVAVALAMAGVDFAALWKPLPVGTTLAALPYGVATQAVWFAPSFAYLMLVSAWSKRAPFLWAALPLFAGMALERLAFGTSYVTGFLRDRITGGLRYAFENDATKQAVTELSQLTPGAFFTAPVVWIGLVAAAAMLYCAVVVRRHREPG
jgi:ABC-2 type transport system permease protein